MSRFYLHAVIFNASVIAFNKSVSCFETLFRKLSFHLKGRRQFKRAKLLKIRKENESMIFTCSLIHPVAAVVRFSDLWPAPGHLGMLRPLHPANETGDTLLVSSIKASHFRSVPQVHVFLIIDDGPCTSHQGDVSGI